MLKTNSDNWTSNWKSHRSNTRMLFHMHDKWSTLNEIWKKNGNLNRITRGTHHQYGLSLFTFSTNRTHIRSQSRMNAKVKLEVAFLFEIWKKSKRRKRCECRSDIGQVWSELNYLSHKYCRETAWKSLTTLIIVSIRVEQKINKKLCDKISYLTFVWIRSWLAKWCCCRNDLSQYLHLYSVNKKLGIFISKILSSRMLCNLLEVAETLTLIFIVWLQMIFKLYCVEELHRTVRTIMLVDRMHRLPVFVQINFAFESLTTVITPKRVLCNVKELIYDSVWKYRSEINQTFVMGLEMCIPIRDTLKWLLAYGTEMWPVDWMNFSQMVFQIGCIRKWFFTESALWILELHFGMVSSRNSNNLLVIVLPLLQHNFLQFRGVPVSSIWKTVFHIYCMRKCNFAFDGDDYSRHHHFYHCATLNVLTNELYVCTIFRRCCIRYFRNHRLAVHYLWMIYNCSSHQYCRHCR